MWYRPCFWPKPLGNLMKYRNKTPGWTSKFSGYVATPCFQQTAGLASVILWNSHCFFIFKSSPNTISIRNVSVPLLIWFLYFYHLTSSSSVLVIWTSSWLWASARLSLASKSVRAQARKYSQTCTHTQAHLSHMFVLLCVALQHCLQ